MKKNIEDEELGFYRDAAVRHSLLSAEEEQELAARIAKGDKAALNELVAHNLKLVMHIVGRYAETVKHSSYVSIEDLIQEGNMGLMHAAEMFDGKRGFRFSTFAIHHIRQRVGRALLDHGTDIRLPVYLATKLRHKDRTVEYLTQKNERPPLDSEVAAVMGISEQTLHRLKQYNAAFNFSNNQAGEDAEFDLIQAAPDDKSLSPEEETEQKVLRENLMAAVSDVLDKADRQIVFGRIGYNDENTVRTLNELGNEMGITRERVRQREGHAMDKLRELDFGKLGFNVSVAEKTE